MPARGHHLNAAEREERNARMRALYAKIAAESGSKDAVAALVARFSVDRETVRNLLKKETT
jgi:adenylylsulfate kinase-like enzyme